MSLLDKFSLVVAVNDRRVLHNNLLASPGLRDASYDLFLQEGYSSAAAAYNEAIERSSHDLLIFAHQDVVLPKGWIKRLDNALWGLEVADPLWGVLGSSGVTAEGAFLGRVYTSGVGAFGDVPDTPAAVQTLDEIVLILRKSSGLRFDIGLPGFHLYGADICLRAAQTGRRSYAFDGFCIHNTNQLLVLPKEFYDSCRFIRRRWKNSLPIRTTCILITRFNIPIWTRRLRELYLRHIRRRQFGGIRSTNVDSLLKQFS